MSNHSHGSHLASCAYPHGGLCSCSAQVDTSKPPYQSYGKCHPNQSVPTIGNIPTGKLGMVLAWGYPWISIKERLPDEDGRYLVCSEGSWRHIEICSLRKGRWDVEKVTHWMVIPEPSSA